MRVQRELLMVRLRLMADFNWRARVARGPVGCKLEGRDELPVLVDCSRSRLRHAGARSGPTTQREAVAQQGCRAAWPFTTITAASSVVRSQVIDLG